MGSFHSGVELAGEGRSEKGEKGGGGGGCAGLSSILNATRVATIVACKINCVTDQKKKAKAKPRKEKKRSRKERKKNTYFLFGQTKNSLVTGVCWGKGKHFCRQFAKGLDSI